MPGKGTGAGSVWVMANWMNRPCNVPFQLRLARASPLSMAATLAMVKAARGDQRMQDALSREYRFTRRATAQSDFLEGVRAQIIDKDRTPVWAADAGPAAVEAMLAPLGDDELEWEDRA